ncbi:MAG: Re/Si-specific NAD(P)(+) transhydrogenase subunit alpha [Acidothermales bacterium]|nr:Re/Si-specific NAD(P)(+) transhydrogenase subunit alpha [Acidothermales bacterium]
MTRVAVPVETRPGERRVALVPDVAARLVSAGLDVAVQSGAGRAAYVSDDDFRKVGAEIVDGDVLRGADVVLCVQTPSMDRMAGLAPGTVLIGLLAPAGQLPQVRALRDARISAFALELVPRISRAQSMDALSSQALVAGYQAMLLAAYRLPRFFPLFMTAAGTVPPASVLVLGAGVAGLQAIATARRLGARVAAYDVRAASGEEVRSLGATFVELDLEALEGAGGYAREMTEERARRQRELLAPHVAAADVLVTTAAVPGRSAPLLVTAEMVAAMRPGSVVVDLAADSGGNVQGSRPGEEVQVGEVTVWGGRNVPSEMPAHASALYARNVANLLLHMTVDGAVRLDFTDEIIAGCCVTHAGEVRHAPTRAALQTALEVGG